MAWNRYPVNYREAEVRRVAAALKGGDCAAVIGLSGCGKSNLLGFFVYRASVPGDAAYAGGPAAVLVDCNRLRQANTPNLFSLIREQVEKASAGGQDGPNLRAGNTLPKAGGTSIQGGVEDHGSISSSGDALEQLEIALERVIPPEGLALAFDRFDALLIDPEPGLFSNLRALRDDFKYRLTFLLAARRSLPADNELAELFFAQTLWLGPLSPSDALWSAEDYAIRHGMEWSQTELFAILGFSGCYAAFLRAACEAHAGGTPLDLSALQEAAPVMARLAEFWEDEPTRDELRHGGLGAVPLLSKGLQRLSEPPPLLLLEARLTAKEQLLLEELRAHPNQVCDKDDLIRAVWPEDRIFMQGVRDDSLAQLVRRLREKVEIDPSEPQHIRTAAGRGYVYVP
jgi:hypothetical protein